jgi:glyoxylase-like metal-dependent hydrolase (beta-lactamase superfamily II)
MNHAVFLSPAKPIPATVPDWPADLVATWPATTATLILGERDAVLVDALMTTDEARLLATWVAGFGRDLTAVYVTHGHADHFFGAGAVLAANPAASLVTLPELRPFAELQLSEGYRGLWNSFFPGHVDPAPAVPGPLSGELTVDGRPVIAHDVGRSDADPSSVVEVPDLSLVVAGDVAYNRTHMWLSGADAAARAGWLEALDTVAKLRPATVVTGHRDPGAPDDDGPRILDESRQYLIDFGDAVDASDSAAELIGRMTAKYGGWGNPYTLWVAAQGRWDTSVHQH